MIRTSRLGLGRAGALIIAAGCPLLLAGCGSGNGTSPLPLSYTAATGGGFVPTPSTTPTPTATPLPSGTRYYQASFPQTGGGVATVNITAQADGAAIGTITLDGPTTRFVSGKSRAVIGTGNLTGTVDFGTGTVSMTGSFTQDGVTTPVSVGGTAPGASGTGGTSKFTLGTTIYTAQWVVSTNGPINSNGNNGGNASGGASAITFSSNSSNITPGNLNAAVGVAIKQTLPYVGDILTIQAADAVNGSARGVSVVFTGITPVAGTAYDLSGGAVTVAYTEGVFKQFGASSGTVTVVSISGKTYTLKLTGVRVDAETGNPTFTGTGSFTIDGTITATLP